MMQAVSAPCACAIFERVRARRFGLPFGLCRPGIRWLKLVEHACACCRVDMDAPGSNRRLGPFEGRVRTTELRSVRSAA